MKSEQHLVSIIVPVYNIEKYVSACIESLVNQTYKNLQIILVDDGATDNSGKICDEWANKHSKIEVVHKLNGGLSDARNYALPYVRGKYVAFVDSDDYVASNMFSELWNVALKTNADIVECELEKVYSDHNERIYLPDKYKNIGDYMLNARVCVWNKIYRVAWLNNINVMFPKGLLYEDLCFFYEITPYLTQMPVTVHIPLYYYRQREGSILSSSTIKILDIHKIFENIFNFYNEKNLEDEFMQIAEYKYVKTLFCSFLMRMLKMKNIHIRNNVIDQSWTIVNRKRPNWKHNKYLKHITLRNIYIRLMSKTTLQIMKLIIR